MIFLKHLFSQERDQDKTNKIFFWF